MAEQKEKPSVKLVEVPTQYEQGFTLPSGETVTYFEYLAWLGDQVHKIARSVA